jgi:hypothetical protein
VITITNYVRLSGRYLRHQINTTRAALCSRRVKQRFGICAAECPAHCARVTKDSCEPTCVDSRYATDIQTLQIFIQVFRASPVASTPRHFPDNYSTGEDCSAFIIRGNGSVVAYVWCGECDNLSGVRRIGNHFLISSHSRVKHHFTTGDRCALGANQFALED